MSSLAAIRTANAAFSPNYGIPVALFLGGTSGIGRAMAERFAHYTNGNAHIIICGRNERAAQDIIATFPKPTKPDEGAKHEFVRCDATLMKNCHATTQDLLTRLPKLNFLVLSPGYLTLDGRRNETEEGIDKKLALNYYARWAFIYDLMPLLRKAIAAGEDAKVMSVLSAGWGGEIDVNDLGLKRSYGLINAGNAAPTYNDLMMEEFASREANMAFTHIYPGGVRTSILNVFTHWALRPLNTIAYVLLYPFAVSPHDCAEYMLHALFEGDKGAYRRGSQGEDMGRRRYYGTPEQRRLLWEHTVESVCGGVSGTGVRPEDV